MATNSDKSGGWQPLATREGTSMPAVFVEPGPAAPAENQNLPAVRNDSEGLKLTDIEELGEALGIVSSMAGPVVNSKTAMRHAIAYACTRLIAGAFATMPLTIYRQEGEQRQKDSGHPIASLLNLQPTPLMSAAMFWEFIVAQVLLEGDGHAVIVRDAFGQPEEFLPVKRTDVVEVQRRGNRLVYFILLEGVIRGFDQDDILHFAGFGFDGTRSLSVIKYAALNTLGLSMAMENFSSDYFKNGAHQDFVVTKEGKWDTQDQENFREAWARTYGGIGNRKKPFTVGKGMGVHQLSINAQDSQLIESREFESINVCTAFGIPAFLMNLGKNVTAWGTGMAEQGMALVRYTLSPHMVRFQQEVNRKLFIRDNTFAEFNSAGLMRGTLKDRNESYKSALGGSNVPGYMSINEVRRLENLPPIDDPIYDKPYDPRLDTLTAKETPNAK